MATTVEELIKYVPEQMKAQSGKVFFSGRTAFEHPAKPVYILSLNPGESPDDQDDRRIQRNLDYVLHEGRNNWSAYRDDPPTDQSRNTRNLRARMGRLCTHLDVDQGCIPTSSLIFARTPTRAHIKNFEESAERCWPFHEAVIRALDIRVIVCASLEVGTWVRNRLAWHVHGDPPKQKQPPGMRLYTPRVTPISVFELPHPSRFSWKRFETDLTGLVEAVATMCTLHQTLRRYDTQEALSSSEDGGGSKR